MSYVLIFLLLVNGFFSLSNIKLKGLEKVLVLSLISSFSALFVGFIMFPYNTLLLTILVIIVLAVIILFSVFIIQMRKDISDLEELIEDNISKGIVEMFLFILVYVLVVLVIPPYSWYIQIGMFILIFGMLKLYRHFFVKRNVKIVIVLLLSAGFMYVVNANDFDEYPWGKSIYLDNLNDAFIGDTYRLVERYDSIEDDEYTYIAATVYDGDSIYYVDELNQLLKLHEGVITVIDKEFDTGYNYEFNTLYDTDEYLYYMINLKLYAYEKDSESITFLYEEQTGDMDSYMVFYMWNGDVYFEANKSVYKLEDNVLIDSTNNPLGSDEYTPFMYNQELLFIKDWAYYKLDNGIYTEIENDKNSLNLFMLDRDIVFNYHNHISSFTEDDSAVMYFPHNIDELYIYDGGIVTRSFDDGLYIERFVEVENVISPNIVINVNPIAVYIGLGLLLVPFRKKD